VHPNLIKHEKARQTRACRANPSQCAKSQIKLMIDRSMSHNQEIFVSIVH